MALKELQISFLQAIFNDDDTILSSILPSPIDQASRLAIYRDSVVNILSSALEKSYPTLYRYTGKKFFSYLCFQYRKHYQSYSGNLDDYGQEMAHLVTTLSQLTRYPYLTDLAKLDWARHLAYQAADFTSLSAADFTSIPVQNFSQLRLTLHPSTQLLSSSYDIHALWEFAQLEETVLSDTPLPDYQKKTWLLIVRPEFKILMFSLSEDAMAFITALHKGMSLYQAYLAAHHVNKMFDMSSSLQHFVQLGVFSALLGKLCDAS